MPLPGLPLRVHPYRDSFCSDPAVDEYAVKRGLRVPMCRLCGECYVLYDASMSGIS